MKWLIGLCVLTMIACAHKSDEVKPLRTISSHDGSAEVRTDYEKFQYRNFGVDPDTYVACWTFPNNRDLKYKLKFARAAPGEDPSEDLEFEISTASKVSGVFVWIASLGKDRAAFTFGYPNPVPCELNKLTIDGTKLTYLINCPDLKNDKHESLQVSVEGACTPRMVE